MSTTIDRHSSKFVRGLFLCLFALFLNAAFQSQAFAACSSPTASEGAQIYNSTFKLMQFCDGTNWVSMSGGGVLVGLSCNDGETITWDAGGSGWVCTSVSTFSDDLGNHTATQDLDMASHKIVNVTDPTLAQDAATKAYVDARTGANETDPQVNTLTSGKWCTTDGSTINCTSNAVTSETDPQVNTLTNGKWCTSDGSVINCTADAPSFGAESDPQVNTLTSGKWCTTDGSVINCTSNAPVTAESDPQVNTLTSGKWCTTDGSVVNCTSDAPLTAESDPQVNTLTSGKWCTTDGSVVNCTTDAPVIAESDPQVGTVSTSGKWCRSNGSAVVCDQNVPITSESDPQVGNVSTSGKWCRSNGSAVVCDRDTPVLTESDPQVGNVATSGQWCRSNGSAVVCDRDAPVTTENDPQVGAMTADLWCRANGSATAINCANTGGTMTGNLTVEGTLSVGANGNGNSVIRFYDDNSNATRPFFWSNDSNDWFAADNGGTNRRIWHAGNDGAGSGLDADTVDGKQASAFITSETDPQVGGLAASKYCKSNAAATAIICNVGESDRRLKKNIKPLGPMLNKVMQMNPVTFEFKKEPGVTQYGLIAQEFEKIIPELVIQPANKDDYMGIDYMFLAVPLIKAIQELKTENDDIEKRLDKLESELDNVKE